MMLILRTAALILSLYGICRFVMRRLRAPVEAALPFAVVSIAVLVTLAGMLNVMRETTYGLFAAGLVLAALSAWRWRESPRDVLTPGVLFALAACALLAVFLRGARFVNYDDFSHWALLARMLLRNDALPTFRDTALSFLNYPPGSACWVYFFCRLTSTGEGAMLFAQALMMLLMTLPLFLLAPKRPIASAAATAALMGYVFLAKGALTLALYVDQLLPMVAAAAMLLSLHSAREPGRAALLALPFALYTYLIKNSGILFSLLLGALVLGCAIWQQRRSAPVSRRDRRCIAGLCIAPVLMLYLWNRHTTMVHVNASATKHAMRPGQLLASFQSKEAQDILDILRAFWTGLGETSLLPLLGLAGIVLCLLVACLRAREARRPLLLWLCGCTAVYVIYLAGLLAMYLFSMPVGEAIGMASLDRYMTTIAYWLAYAATAAALWLLGTGAAGRSRSGQAAAVGLALYAAVFLWAAGVPDPTVLYAKQAYPASDRAQIEACIQAHAIPAGQRYVLLSMRDSGLSYYIFQYLLDPAYLTMNLEEWQAVDAVIVYDPKPLELVYLNETVLAGDDPPTIYDCQKPSA